MAGQMSKDQIRGVTGKGRARISDPAVASSSALTDHDLALKSIRLRKRMLQAIFHAGAGHTGGSLSCLDILNVLYNRVLRVAPETFTDPGRDRYIQSKGHSVEALYAVLSDRGFFPDSDLDT